MYNSSKTKNMIEKNGPKNKWIYEQMKNIKENKV